MKTNINELTNLIQSQNDAIRKLVQAIDQLEFEESSTKSVKLTYRRPTDEELEKLHKHEPGCTIPILVLEAVNEVDNHVVKRGYLTPFRACKFQVSGSITGGGDHGSSPVINLPKIARMNRDDSFYLILPHVQYAIQQWFSEYGYVHTTPMFGLKAGAAEEWFNESLEWLCEQSIW